MKILLFIFLLQGDPEPDESYSFVYRVVRHHNEGNPYYVAIGSDPRADKPYSFVGAKLPSGYLGKEFPDGIYMCWKSGDKRYIQKFQGNDPFTDKVKK